VRPGFDQVEPGVEDARACRVRERSPAGDHGRERGTAGGRTAEPFDEVVQPPVGHLGQEGQGHVEVLRERPSERRGLASYIEERVEILDHVERWDQGREHPHPAIQTPPVRGGHPRDDG
jgi:hypothetical protein